MSTAPAALLPRALVVSRYPVVIAHLESLFGDLISDAEVVTARSLEAAQAAMHEATFGVVACDLDGLLPFGSHIDNRHQTFGCAKWVFFGSRQNPEIVRMLQLGGADGYIPWTTELDDMEMIVADILGGRRWFGSTCRDCSDRAAPRSQTQPKLTPRQKEVHALLQRGATNKMIAAALGMSPATAKIHVNAILKALGVKNRTEAAVFSTLGAHPCVACAAPFAANAPRLQGLSQETS